MILSGDVGGTKCNLALFQESAGGLKRVFERRYSSQDYQCLEDIISAFLKDASDVLAASPSKKIVAAGFGVAGPVIGTRVQVTNLSWAIESESLQRQLGTPHVVLLNDLEASGYSLAWLSSSDLCTLNEGVPAPKATQCLVAAGTGLGEAILLWNDGRYRVAPSEGGHTDFSPRTEQEIELLRYMKLTNKYVSFELILSGRGFYTLHQFLNPAVRHASFEQPGEDPAPEITRRGLDGSCPVCVETLDLFTTLYGAEAGNMALKSLSLGGVFVAGGIGPKILPKMKSGGFVRAFREKEKFEELLSRIPIWLVLNEEAPLLGSAAEAARRLHP